MLKRIPVTQDLHFLKQLLANESSQAIVDGYDEEWWIWWLEWAIERYLYGTSELDYHDGIGLTDNLAEAGLGSLAIARFQSMWLNHIANKLQLCEIYNPTVSSRDYDYAICTTTYPNSEYHTYEAWIVADIPPDEFNYLLTRTGLC